MLVFLGDIGRIKHVDPLQVIVENLVAILLCDIKLMGVPQLGENFLYIMFMHAKARQVNLRAHLANERAIGGVGMR